MRANKNQIGGSHYKGAKIEVWDFITANEIGYLEGNAIKYLARWKRKGGVQDIEKALHYVQKLLEVAKTAQADAVLSAIESVVEDILTNDIERAPHNKDEEELSDMYREWIELLQKEEVS